MRCPGHHRHWFSVHGQAYLRSPVCVRCGEPNPRPLTDDDWDYLDSFARSNPGYLTAATLRALEAWRKAPREGEEFEA